MPTANIMRLNETTRELLDMMNFGSIPPEAKAIAFLPDGSALYIEKLEFYGFFVPSPMFVSMYRDVPFTTED